MRELYSVIGLRCKNNNDKTKQREKEHDVSGTQGANTSIVLEGGRKKATNLRVQDGEEKH